MPDPAACQFAMLRLGSAALPTGAFAYSQGLESAISQCAVRSAAEAEAWIRVIVTHSLFTCDVPLLVAMRGSLDASNELRIGRLNAIWRATRGTRELRDEDRQMGQALLRLLSGQPSSLTVASLPSPTFGYAFARAGFLWSMGPLELAQAYCFSWIEAQLSAATRLVPLGQGEAQAVLTRLLDTAAQGIESALRIDPDEVTSSVPGQLIYSAQHESLYSRLFRS